MPLQAPVLRVLGDILDAERKLLLLKGEADDLTKNPYSITLTANQDALNAAFLDAIDKYKALQALFDSDQIKLQVDDLPAQATLAKLAAEYEALGALLNKGLTSGLTDRQLMNAIADTALLTSKVDGFKTSMEDAAKEAELASAIFATSFIKDGTAGAGLWGLGAKINLFGGTRLLPDFMTSIAGWHLALDAGLEIAAVWVPALIALGIAAVGAAPVVADLYKELSNVDVVAQATGGKIGFMNGAVSGSVGAYQKLQNAMQPGIVELFGDALDVLGHKTGIFNQIALGTEHVLDMWGAQMTNALDSGAGQVFLKNSVSDFQQLGQSLGYFFSDLGKIVKDMPGVAHVLLDFGGGFLMVTGHVLDAISPLVKWGLALHGAMIWGGLLATVLVMLYQKAILPVAEAIIGKLVPALTTLVTTGEATGSLAFLANPAFWGVAAIAAFAAVLYEGDKAATAFNTTIQSKLSNTALPALRAGLAEAIAQTKDFAIAEGALTGSQAAHLNQIITNPNAVRGMIQTALSKSPEAVESLEGLSQLDQQTLNYNSNLAALGRTFGGVTQAQNIATLAGVTSNQMLAKGAQNLATMRQMMQGYVSGMQGMGQSTGMLGNDLDVLNSQSTDTYTNMQKLNSAWDQQITNVTGSNNALDTYLQGLTTLASSGDKVTLTLGKLQHGFVEGKAAIDGLTPSDIALNQAFQSQVSNANALIDTYRTAGLATSDFKGAVAASIDPLLKYANGSKDATAELAALAEEAGYDGPATMKSLTAWLGNGADATLKLKQAAEEATIQEALLTGAMQNQGNAISSELLSQLGQAEVKYSGVSQDVEAYGKAIAQSGIASNAAASARSRLIDDIVKMGLQTHSTTGQIAAMITKLLDVPTQLAIRMVLNAEAQLSIQEHINEIFSGDGGHHPVPSATGRLVPPGYPNDTFLARLTSGEAVVPRHLTPAVAPFLAAHGVPGFASGWVPPRMSSYNSYGGPSGDTHIWNIKGDTDPHGAAKRIQSQLRSYKTSIGNQPLGLR